MLEDLIEFLWEFKWMWLVVALVVWGVIWLVERNERAWQVYAAEHHCTRTGNKHTYTTMQPIYGAKGQVTSSVPKIHTNYEWSCDNNEIIWR